MRLLMRLVAALALTVISTPRSGAAEPESLRGIKEFSILIEPLDKAAQSCGFTETSIEADLRTIIGQSRITLVKTADAAMISFAFTAAPNCEQAEQAGDIAAVLRVTGPSTVGSVKNPSDAALWSETFVRSGPNAAPEAGVMIDRLARKLLSDWNGVNPNW
jgi:hypothetical protein